MPMAMILLMVPCLAAAATDDVDRVRQERGAKQVAALWRAEDGSAADMKKFVAEEFVATGAALDGLFVRFEEALEQMYGHFLEIARALARHVELDLGPVTSLDKRMAELDPAAHLTDDLFASKIGMIALLNFPLTTLKERLDEGDKWSRRQWAEVRLAQRFERRVPAVVQQKLAAAGAAARGGTAPDQAAMH